MAWRIIAIFRWSSSFQAEFLFSVFGVVASQCFEVVNSRLLYWSFFSLTGAVTGDYHGNRKSPNGFVIIFGY